MAFRTRKAHGKLSFERCTGLRIALVIWLHCHIGKGNSDGVNRVVGTMFGAGSGTSAAAMMSFVLAMVHHPKWQKKVQDEVDEQVGNDRMPEFSDMPKLPTVRAFVKEVLRWRPVTAGGIPHMSVEDDV